MQSPEKPENETSRLAALHALNILDTPPEERFDRLTRMAKRLFGVPIALISLVDSERQWFKSRQGIDGTEGPRETSFCGHAILGDEVFLIPDATRDERFHDNPAVTGDPNVRFYAGCPLRVGNGGKIGTLCIVDRQPRELNDEDRLLLKDLAKMAEEELSAVHLATTDELTLLSNRRGFEALSRHALSVCRRVQREAFALYFDLDSFKTINDKFGHREGDYALTKFAECLMNTFRQSDVIARLGGDEFAVLSTTTVSDTFDVPLSRLQEQISEHNESAGRGYEIGYSVGIAQFDPKRHSDIRDLLVDADHAMYEQKRARKSH